MALKLENHARTISLVVIGVLFPETAYCAHFVLNSTSLQLIPAYSSQSGVGLSEPE